MSKPRKRKRQAGFPAWLTPVKCEGQRFVITDFGNVRISDKAAKWFMDYHARPRLKPKTIERRAQQSLEAAASFMSERAWRAGKELQEL